MMEEKKTVAFTSIAVNYLPKARILAKSIKKYHPEWHMVLLLADRIPSWLDVDKEDFDEIMALGSLSIGRDYGWVFSHDIEELCTAIKPFAMTAILSRKNVESCLYIDPDMVLFDRLDDLLDEFENGDVLLTPHQLTPGNSYDSIIDHEIGSLRHGIFNLGFLGVKNNSNGAQVVHWWRDRVKELCLARVDLHLWTDQKWFNFAPVYFDRINILRQDRFNVAPWNIASRIISGSFEKGFLVNGHPLGFYHFTGFDNGDHSIQLEKYASVDSGAKDLVKWYKNQNDEENKKMDYMDWFYGYYSNGERIKLIERLIYRYRRDLQSDFPNPYEVDEDSYKRWIETQGKMEYGDLLNHEEKSGADIPDIPAAEWLKWFPPEFLGNNKSEYIYPANIDGNILSNSAKIKKTRLKINASKLTKLLWEFAMNRDRREVLSRKTLAIYKTSGIKGIVARVRYK
ncbi:glycosyl transferase [Acidihalobacter ferrooxydans]|uniref:glycosyl transferase n=1 Tax=Acidihalobacter ferrooxydans TaxID=1765967 RepID=UPI0012EBD1CD|nr:glycosyl transferase [Acidihalobacter ferrooxydans]